MRLWGAEVLIAPHRTVGRAIIETVKVSAVVPTGREAAPSAGRLLQNNVQYLTIYYSFPQASVLCEGEVCLRARRLPGGGSGSGL